MLIRPLPSDELPLYYQIDDVSFIFDRLQAGDSVSLVAIGSGGKSNLLQFLTRDPIKKRHLPRDLAPHFITVVIDPHNMICLQGAALEAAGAHWAGYQVMLNRLRYALHGMLDSPDFKLETPQDVAQLEALIDEVEGAYEQLLSPDPIRLQTGLCHLEDALFEIFHQDETWRVVFLFDEIEELFNMLPPEFFQSLRGLRDDFKRRLLYVTASRYSLNDLVAQRAENAAKGENPEHVRTILEGFYELFTEHYLRPLDKMSAEASIDRYFSRAANLLTLDEREKRAITNALLIATGGHAGLLRRSFRIMTRVFRDTSEYIYDYPANMTLHQFLLVDEDVLQECETIFLSLSPNERITLMFIARGKPPTDEAALRELVFKKMVDISNNTVTICLRILQDFIIQNPQLVRKTGTVPTSLPQ